MSQVLERSAVHGIIPFYADPELSPDEYAVFLTQTLRSIAHLGLRHPVVLVDDGDTLRGGVDLQDVVETIRLKPRGGKAEAVRYGIARALDRNPQLDYLIQSDFNGDPSPRQAQRMVRTLQSRGITGNVPAMVLGERDEALDRRGYLDEHRRAIFEIQQTFCAMLGYPQLTDPTTGLRVYTRALAERFLDRGKATDFGSDIEQLVIARLVGAEVLPYKLKVTRKRANFTPINKFRDCQVALILHEDDLRAIGLDEVVDTFGGEVTTSTLANLNLNISD